MEINDLDISHDNTDFIITGGKDCKVKVWLLSNIMNDGNCFAEFNEH
jgi:WD40 repeat protein